MSGKPRKSYAEEAEDLQQAWRGFLLALGVGKVVDWLTRQLDKLTKEDGE